MTAMSAARDPRLADAHRRALAIPAARNPELQRGLVRRVLFDLRAILRRGPRKESR